MGTGALIAVLIAAIVLVVVLIITLKLHASIALLMAAFLVAIVTGVPLTEIGDVVEAGVGGTLGFLTLIIGLGAVLGKMLEVSGGAERLANSLLKAFGMKNATVVMSVLGLIAGIPVFVEVGFVLLVPLVFVVAKEAKISRITVGIPLAVSLMTVHCILPPHPAATAIAGTLGADIGKVIIFGFLVAVPTTLVGGPLFARLFVKGKLAVPAKAGAGGVAVDIDEHGKNERELPGFGITLFTILLPLLIMVSKTILVMFLQEGSLLFDLVSFFGHPIMALLLSVLFCYWALGLRRGLTLPVISSVTDGAFAPIGGILLIIGAGGAFNAVLIESGIAPALADALSGVPVSPIILAWLIAMVLHFAVGSATVAMMSAAGIVLPMLALNPSISPEVMAIAVGAGAIGLTQVTDSLFWMVKEYLGMSVPQALRTITVGTTIASTVALCGALVLNLFV